MKKAQLMAAGVGIDEKHEHLLDEYEWHFNAEGYVRRTEYVNSNESKCHFLHHAILPREEGKETDHIDRNKKNNHSNNLRNVTRLENANNREHKTNKNGVTVLKTWCIHISEGIEQNAKNLLFYVKATRKKRTHRIGVFKTLEQAQKAYEDFVAKHPKSR